MGISKRKDGSEPAKAHEMRNEITANEQ